MLNDKIRGKFLKKYALQFFRNFKKSEKSEDNEENEEESKDEEEEKKKYESFAHIYIMNSNIGKNESNQLKKYKFNEVSYSQINKKIHLYQIQDFCKACQNTKKFSDKSVF